MKRKTDPRHLKRVKLLKDLFSWQFRPAQKPKNTIQKIISHLVVVDKLIKKSAPDRPLSQINKIDLAILRLAVFELIIEKETPPKVVIDEAVELGKEFGSDTSASFINGALGKMVKIKNLIT